MTTTDERMDRFDARLDAMGQDVSVLKQDVSVLKDDVKELKADVTGLKKDVQDLKDDTKNIRVLVEEHDTQSKLIGEVLAVHGERLNEHGKLLQDIKQQLNRELAPIADFVRRIASEHGARLDALEKHTGLS